MFNFNIHLDRRTKSIYFDAMNNNLHKGVFTMFEFIAFLYRASIFVLVILAILTILNTL